MPIFTVTHTTADGKSYTAEIEADTKEQAQQILNDELAVSAPNSEAQLFRSSFTAPNGKSFEAEIEAYTQDEADQILQQEISEQHPFAFKEQNPYDAQNPYAPDETNYRLPEQGKQAVDMFQEQVKENLEGVRDFSVAAAVGFSDVGGNIMDATADIINVVDEDNVVADTLKEQVAKQRETAEDLIDTTANSPYAATIGRMAPTMAAYVGGGGAIFKGLTKLGTSAWSAGVMSGMITDQLFTNVDENLGNVVSDLVPAEDRNMLLDAIASLAANPDDTVAEKRLKLLVEGAAVGGVFGIFFDTPLLTKAGVSAKKGANWLEAKTNASKNADRLTDYVKDKVKSFRPDEEPTPVEGILNKHKMIPTPPSQVERQANNYWTSRMLDTTFTRNGFWTAEAHNGFEGAEHAIRQNMSEMTHITRRMKTAIDRAVQQGPWNAEEITGWVSESLSGFGEFKNKDEMWAVIQHKYNLPADLVDEIVDARTLLDDLSKQALNLDVVDDGLKEILNENLGNWVRRSYQMFEGNWTNNNELQQAALDSLASGMKGKNMDKKMKKAAEILQGVMDQASGKEAADYYTSARKLNKRIFKKKGELDPAMREWMGEITNPTDNLLLSTQKLSTFIHKAKFYDDLYKQAHGDYILDHAHDNFDKPIQGTGTALDGMFTSQGIIDAMKDRQGSWLDVMTRQGEEPGILTQIWRGMLLTKGATQKAKTIYSHQTHLRNALGGMQMIMANGFNPIDMQYGLSLVKNEIFQQGNKALDTVYEELVGRGVINTSVKVNELRALIDEGMNIFTSKHPLGDNQFLKGLDAADTVIEDIYMGTDDVFKITAYFKELDVLKQAHPELSGEEVKDLAASIVKNTMPNYDRVPPGIKALRELPLGNFVAFPAEIFRTSGHVIKRGIEEITSGNEVLVARGMKRLGGYLGSMSMWGLAGTMSAKYLGLSEEEEEALNTITRPQAWDTTSTKIYMRDSDTGDILVNDTYNLNAYSFIKELYQKPVSSIMKGVDEGVAVDDIIGKAAVEFLDALSEPFVSQSIITKALVNDIGIALMSEDGRTPEGKQLFPVGASPLDNMLTALEVLFKAVQPGSLQSLEKLYEAYDGEIDIDTGEPKQNLGYEAMANLTGIKFRKVNPSKSLISSLYKYNRDTRNKVRTKLTTAESADDFLQMYIDSNRAEYDLQKELYRMAKAVETVSGREEAYKLLTDSKYGVGEDKAISILQGKFAPVTVPEEMIMSVFQGKRPELRPEAPTLYSTIFRLHYGLMNTSLASFKDEQTEEGEYSERGRILRAEGGLVQDPAMRRDPYTGRPYGAVAKDLIDPLQRLGFVRGGYVRQQYSLGGQVIKGIFKTAGRQAPKELKDKSVFRASESLAANPLTREDLYQPTKISFMADNIQNGRGFDEGNESIFGDEHTIFDLTDPKAAENLKAIGYEPQEGAAFVSIKKKHDGEEIPMFFQDEDEILEFYNKGVGEFEALKGAKHSPMDGEFSKTWRSEEDIFAYPFINPKLSAVWETDLDEDFIDTVALSLYDADDVMNFIADIGVADKETIDFLKENIKPVSKDVVRRVRQSPKNTQPHKYYFHGTQKDFDEFDRSKTVFVSEDPDIASEFAGQMEGANVRKFTLDSLGITNVQKDIFDPTNPEHLEKLKPFYEGYLNNDNKIDYALNQLKNDQYGFEGTDVESALIASGLFKGYKVPAEKAVAVLPSGKGKFLRGSTHKLKVFRSSWGDEPTTDLLIAIQNPRELGVHVGANAGQSNVLMRPGIQKYMKDLKADPYAKEAPILRQSEYEEAFESVDPDTAYGSVDRPTRQVGANLAEYYINIKNPLKVDIDIGRWGAEDIVEEMRKLNPANRPQPIKVVRTMSRKLNYYDTFGAEGDEMGKIVNDYIMADLTGDTKAATSLKAKLKDSYVDVDEIDAQVKVFSEPKAADDAFKGGEVFRDSLEENLGRKLTKEEWDELDKISLPDEPVYDPDAIGLVKYEAQVYRANRQFRKWLQDLGFDSIEYKNTGEASFEGADQRSWIIFDHSQIKSARAESFDITDPRVSKAMGGLVRNRDKYAKGGKVDDPSMYRRDGSTKSAKGFLGPVENKAQGGTMTEVSVGIEIEGKEMEVPTMVPTLTPEEIDTLANMQLEGNAKNIPQSIIIKAKEHAIKRLKEGKSVYYVDGEEREEFSQGGMVPMPPEVMQPEAQEIVNPPLNQSNLQLGDESVAGMGTGLIMRSLKRRFR